MKKYFFLAAAAAMMLSACSFDRDLDYDGSAAVPEGPIPMALTATNSVSAVVSTRSNVNDIQATTLDVASTITTGIFVLDKQAFSLKATPGLYEKWNLASVSYGVNSSDNNKTNIMTAATTDANTLYYPDSKSSSIDIYAYAPRDGSYTGTNISSGKVTVTIKGNQSTNADYLLSDVLWGCVGDGTNWDPSIGTSGGAKETKTGNNSNATISATQYLAAKSVGTGTSIPGFVDNSGEVIIPMFHKASKIIIKITPSGMSLDKLKGATVNFYVQGTNATTPKLSTTLLVSSGVIDPVTAEATEVLAPITFTEHLGQDYDASTSTATDLTNAVADPDGSKGVVGVKNTSMSAYACSGIILPQTITKGQKLIEITLSDGTTNYAYFIPNNDPTNDPDAVFLSEKVYTYSIALTASGLALTTTVEDWDDDTASLPGGSGSGSAVLQ